MTIYLIRPKLMESIKPAKLKILKIKMNNLDPILTHCMLKLL